MADPSRSFKRPSVQALAEIAKDLGLTEAQTHELDLVLQDLQDQVDSFFGPRIDRTRLAELKARLESVRKALSSALKAIGPDPEDLSEVLTFDLRVFLAQSLSPAFIFSVTGRAAPSGESVADLATTESYFHGGRLLHALIGPILHEVERGLAAGPRDPGGRPPNIVRQRLIMTLADAAPDIIGRRATATAKGPFVTLLNPVFQACDLSTEGLEEAAEDALAKWRERKRRLRAAEKMVEDLLARESKRSRALRGAGR